MNLGNKKRRRTAIRRSRKLTYRNYNRNEEIMKRIIRGMRDSLGVPMEPDEVIYDQYDIFGDEIRAYDDVKVYGSYDGLVLSENMSKWLIPRSNAITEGVVTYFDGEVAWAGDYDTLEFEGEYYTEDTVNEFIEFLGFDTYTGEELYEI